jgi:N utilization substance protein A
MAVSANRLELLQIADAVAREKVIDKQIVLDAMADAIAKAARSRYGAETDVHAEINPKTGELRLSRHLLVVDDAAVENDSREIPLSDARKRNPAAQIGDAISETLPPFDFGRIAAQSAKQVIVQKVRDAERDRQYQEYKDRIGEIVNGVVKRVEYGNVIVDLGRGEAIVRRDELEIGFAPICSMSVAKSAARRSSCPGRIRNSWRGCSGRRFPRSTTASSR